MEGGQGGHDEGGGGRASGVQWIAEERRIEALKMTEDKRLEAKLRQEDEVWQEAEVHQEVGL